MNKDTISYFITLFGIEATPYIALDIENDLRGINGDDFRVFSKANINNEDIRYKNGGLQKFNSMIDLYKKQKRKEIINKAISYNDSLYSRINIAFNSYDDMELPIENISFENFKRLGKKIFEDKELLLLDEVAEKYDSRKPTFQVLFERVRHIDSQLFQDDIKATIIDKAIKHNTKKFFVESLPAPIDKDKISDSVLKKIKRFKK